MSLNIDQIAEAFCSYRFVVKYPYLADEIKLHNFKIRKIKPQAWPAVMSINFRMSDLLRLHHTSLS